MNSSMPTLLFTYLCRIKFDLRFYLVIWIRVGFLYPESGSDPEYMSNWIHEKMTKR